MPIVHSDVELGRCVYDAKIPFAQRVPDDVFRVLSGAHNTAGVRYTIDFQRLQHLLDYGDLFSITANGLAPNFGVLHPVKEEEITLFLTDLMQGLTPVGGVRLPVAPCSNNPQALAARTACCNRGIYTREATSNKEPICIADQCSAIRPECPAHKRDIDATRPGAVPSADGGAAAGRALLARPHAVVASLDPDSADVAALSSEIRNATGVAAVPLAAVRGSQTVRGDGIDDLVVGQIGLRLTFRRAVEDAISSNASALFFFEDDALLDDEFETHFKELLESERCWDFLASPGGILQLSSTEWTMGAFGIRKPVHLPDTDEYKELRDLIEENDLWLPASVDAQMEQLKEGEVASGDAMRRPDNWHVVSRAAATSRGAGMCYNSLPKTFGGAGMVLSANVLPLVRDWLSASNRPLDHVFEYVKLRGFPVRVMYPNLVIQATHKSTVNPNRSNRFDTDAQRNSRHRWNLRSYHKPALSGSSSS